MITLPEAREIYTKAKEEHDLLRWLQYDFDYEVVLEEYLEDRAAKSAAEHGPHKPHTFRPSELGSCMRRLILNIMAEKDPVPIIPPNKLKIFFWGDMIQDYAVDPVLSWWMEKYQLGTNGVERSICVTINHPTKPHVISIRGRIDENITIKGDTFILPMEVKTQSDYIEKKLEPSAHHRPQLLTYMVANGSQMGKFIYVEKVGNPKLPDDRVSVTLHYPFNYREWQDLCDLVVYLDDCLIDGKIPCAEGKLDKAKNWECNPKICPFKQLCDNNECATEVLVKDWKVS